MSVAEIAAAAVRIEIEGTPLGTGFRFLDDETVLTNAHVVEPTIREGVPVRANTGTTTVELELVDYSPEPEAGGHDYAILTASEGFPPETEPLQPCFNSLARGDDVLFAGYPFELSEVLVHSAMVSGEHEYGFYLDGSVNWGNSGGPIVNAETGRVVGIITERELYQDRKLEEITHDLRQIENQLLRVQRVYSTTVNDIELEELTLNTVQEIQDAIAILLENANSGLGIGYDIEHVLDGLEENGIDTGR
ncbi:S1 family peptidase [Natrinema gari]|uniref:Peptidase S1 and S6 chymotrypsin/Hap n=1 Tax=Natrinema gari JCM 14663 TaxID=1230459 RepID=L9Z823_9EURY|nr:serine protease [Natrinema gari]ELY82655.1 hypothetical protein C486_04503 [Natrinema gari JCM 14663]